LQGHRSTNDNSLMSPESHPKLSRDLADLSEMKFTQEILSDNVTS
jgi:hypothetical protein